MVAMASSASTLAESRTTSMSNRRTEGTGKGARKGGGGGGGGAADDDDDDDAEDGDFRALPKVTNNDLALAFQQRSSVIARPDSFVSGRRSGEGGDGALLECGMAGTRLDTGEPVKIFGGIIDILQIYGARKKLEHQYKSIRYRHEREGISVTDPTVYAARMTKFLLSKFVPAAGGAAADGAAAAAAADASGGDASGGVLSAAAAAASGSSSSAASATSPSSSAAAAARAASVAAGMVPPLLAGKLEKKSSSFPYGWGSRYCEVDKASKTLVYYYAEQEKSDGRPPRGQRALKSLRYAGEGASNVLSLAVADNKDSSKERTLVLRFPDAALRQQWYVALKNLIGEDPPPDGGLYTSTSFSHGDDGPVAAAI